MSKLTDRISEYFGYRGVLGDAAADVPPLTKARYLYDAVTTSVNLPQSLQGVSITDLVTVMEEYLRLSGQPLSALQPQQKLTDQNVRDNINFQILHYAGDTLRQLDSQSALGGRDVDAMVAEIEKALAKTGQNLEDFQTLRWMAGRSAAAASAASPEPKDVFHAIVATAHLYSALNLMRDLDNGDTAKYGVRADALGMRVLSEIEKSGVDVSAGSSHSAAGAIDLLDLRVSRILVRDAESIFSRVLAGKTAGYTDIDAAFEDVVAHFRAAPLGNNLAQLYHVVPGDPEIDQRLERMGREFQQKYINVQTSGREDPGLFAELAIFHQSYSETARQALEAKQAAMDPYLRYLLDSAITVQVIAQQGGRQESEPGDTQTAANYSREYVETGLEALQRAVDQRAAEYIAQQHAAEERARDAALERIPGLTENVRQALGGDLGTIRTVFEEGTPQGPRPDMGEVMGALQELANEENKVFRPRPQRDR